MIKGKSQGRNLGFPTANIETENSLIPEGVFVTLVNFKDQELPAVSNVGIRPTFNSSSKNIETHIIRFEENLYGQRINLSFLQKLRDEKKFKSPEDLSRQIQKDLKYAESYFSRKNPP